jgi:hypothetical protein
MEIQLDTLDVYARDSIANILTGVKKGMKSAIAKQTFNDEENK